MLVLFDTVNVRCTFQWVELRLGENMDSCSGDLNLFIVEDNYGSENAKKMGRKLPFFSHVKCGWLC